MGAIYNGSRHSLGIGTHLKVGNRLDIGKEE